MWRAGGGANGRFCSTASAVPGRRRNHTAAPGAGQGALQLHNGACARMPPIMRSRHTSAATDTLATTQEISAFLAEVERRAFKQAMFAVRDEDAALDIVQDAMLKLTEKYADKPAAELPMLFQRILQNTIHDHFRRQKVRSTWTTLLSALGKGDEKDDDFDPLETLPAKSDSNVPADPARAVRAGAGYGIDRTGAGAGCRRVNAKRSCCVTGKNWTWRKPPPRWAARKAASRRTAPGPSMRWPRCCRPKG